MLATCPKSPGPPWNPGSSGVGQWAGSGSSHTAYRAILEARLGKLAELLSAV